MLLAQRFGLLFLLFFFFYMQCNNDDTQRCLIKNITISALSNDDMHAIDSFIDASMFVEHITFQSDVYLEKDEFYYLIGIAPKTLINADDLKRAILYLKKKNRFESISLMFYKNAIGFDLHFNLEGTWIFHSLKFHGSVLGKDKYCQYYALDSSEPFDIRKHRDSILLIKTMLQQDGYFEVTITDYLEYDTTNKSITAHLIVDPGEQYTIEHVHINLIDNYAALDKNIDAFSHKVIQKCAGSLQNIRFSQSQIDQQKNTLKDYLAKCGFWHASIEEKPVMNNQEKTVQLHIDVLLGQRKKIIFFGNHFFKKNELFRHISAFGPSMHVLPISIIAEELIELYKSKGFWSIKIEPRQEHNNLFFIIDEGHRMIIDDIRVKGIEAFQEITLKKQFFKTIMKHRFFDADALNHALSNFISFYIKEGFWDVKVLRQQHIPLEKKDHYAIEITIDEGKRRFLHELIISIPELVEKEPFAQLCKKLPVPFDPHIIQGHRQWLVNYFQQHGYLYVDIKHEVTEIDEKVTLIWQIHLKESVTRFGKTIFTGFNSIPLKKLMYRLSYKQGDVWNKDQLNESLQRLRSLNVFEIIQIYPHAMSHPEPEKTVIIKLIEDDPCEIRLRLGFQQVGKNLTFREGTTYKVGGSLLYKNPAQSGDHIFINADVTKFYRYVSAAYCYPWGLYNPMNLLFKGYTNKYTQPVTIGSNKPLYNARQEGVLCGLTRAFNSMDFGLHSGIEFMETKGLSVDLARAINFEPALIGKRVPYLYCEPAIFIDYLDDKLNPTKGSLSAFSAKGMYSWKRGAANFMKFLVEQSVFVPLYSLILGLRIRFGHIFNKQFSEIMPIERFYLGGAFSLRGYEPDHAPPLGVFIENDGKRLLVPQGGRSMFNANIEIRFSFFKNFGATLFQDFGILSETALSDIKADSLLASTGFGLRYNTPVGPLRLDFGFRWKRHDLDNAIFAWFLTFGNAF